jgi:hypothetical protein
LQKQALAENYGKSEAEVSAGDGKGGEILETKQLTE